jgi:release factor glutamine methyltransferase
MVKPFDLIRTAKEKLIHSETPQLDAEVILSYVLDKDRIYLFLNRNEEISVENEETFNRLIERRSKGEPVAYITGSKEFMGLNFKVKPGVLIPRADTEILVEEVIKRTQEDNLAIKNTFFDEKEAIDNMKNCNQVEEETEKIQRNNLIIVDIGCGSGAISVSLAKYIEKAMVYAIDIMDIPIEMTKENIRLNNIESRVKVIKSDLMSGLDRKFVGNIDVIVSNPPYIEQDEYDQLMIDVKKFEPKSALTDEGDGLEFYRRITAEATAYLKKNGLLAYEIGYNQAEHVIKIMQENGFFKVECMKDLGNQDRVVVGYFNGEK